MVKIPLKSLKGGSAKLYGFFYSSIIIQNTASEKEKKKKRAQCILAEPEHFLSGMKVTGHVAIGIFQHKRITKEMTTNDTMAQQIHIHKREFHLITQNGLL